ncbi:MAG: site-2 protease family protein [Anaerolineaceae bacterium]|nr:site-2 protease family protein [Anaerolineaceae bacterium]
MLGLDPPVLISRIITLIIAFTLHEFSHAFTANALGDDTPRLAGRLTLNPFAHLDLMGTLMLLFAGFGWAKPVPVNPYNLRQKNKAGLMLVSLAGPTSNLIMAIIAALPLRFGLVSFFNTSNNFLPTLGQFLLEFVVINITLFLFNLIPLSPLDGEKVLSFFLPPNLARAYEKIRPYGPIILLMIVFIGPLVNFDILGMVIRTPMINLTRFLIGIN